MLKELNENMVSMSTQTGNLYGQMGTLSGYLRAEEDHNPPLKSSLDGLHVWG